MPVKRLAGFSQAASAMPTQAPAAIAAAEFWRGLGVLVYLAAWPGPRLLCKTPRFQSWH